MRLPIIAAALLSAAPLLAQAADVRVGGLQVASPWSRPAPAGGAGVGYMILSNDGKTADALVSVTSPLARRAEVHRSMSAGGMSSMQGQARLALPAGGVVTFAPGGYHLMFMGLTRALKPGDALPSVLTFASGARMSVAFQVGTGPAAAAAHHGAGPMPGM